MREWIETLRSTLVILLHTTNWGLRFAVSRHLSAHICDLRFVGGSSWLPCLLSFIHLPLFRLSNCLLNYVCLRQNLILKKKKSFFSNIGLWCFRVQKPCNKSFTSGAWSSPTNMNLKPQTWRQGPGHVTFFKFTVCGKCQKASILRSLM